MRWYPYVGNDIRSLMQANKLTANATAGYVRIYYQCVEYHDLRAGNIEFPLAVYIFRLLFLIDSSRREYASIFFKDK